MGNKYQQKQLAEEAAAKAATEAVAQAADKAFVEEPVEPAVSADQTVTESEELKLAEEVREEAEQSTAALAAEMEQAVVEPEPVAVIEPTPEPSAVAATIEVVEPSPSALERFGGASAVARSNIDFLSQYAEEMHPKKPLSSDRTRRNQRTLLRTIKTAIALPKAEDMIAVLNALIKLIAENRSTAFSEYYVFRDLANVELSQEEISQFTHLMQLFLVLSDATERKTYAKTIDMGLVTKWILDEQVRSRFLAYCARAAG